MSVLHAVIASAAKQSMQQGFRDCRVAAFLAMTKVD